VKTSFLSAEDIAAGQKRLAEIGERNRRESKQVNGKDHPAHDWDAPDESVLDDRRGELPSFPVDAMPGKKIIDLCAWRRGIVRSCRGAVTRYCIGCDWHRSPSESVTVIYPTGSYVGRRRRA